MKRQDEYVGGSGDGGQMSAPRYNNNNNSGPGMGHFSRGTDSYHPGEESQYGSSKAEGGRWQWNNDGPKGSNQIPSHIFKQGQGNDAPRSLYETLSVEKHSKIDPKMHVHQDNVETVYEDNTLPQTFEGVELKFLNDIMNLTKELHEAEDREKARHRERMIEINAQFDEKMQNLRVRQASQRKELLRKESQLRHQQLQANMNNYESNPGPAEAHGFGSAGVSGNAYVDLKRPYGGGAFEPYVDRSDFGGNSRGGRNVRGHGMESRSPYPGGRAYNSGGRQF